MYTYYNHIHALMCTFQQPPEMQPRATSDFQASGLQLRGHGPGSGPWQRPGGQLCGLEAGVPYRGRNDYQYYGPMFQIPL